MTAKGKKLRLWSIVTCAVVGIVALPIASAVTYLAWLIHDRAVKRYVRWKPGEFQELRAAGEIVFSDDFTRERVIVDVDEGLVDVRVLDNSQVVWQSQQRFSDYHRWAVARDVDGSVWLCSSDIGTRRVERIDGQWSSRAVDSPEWFTKPNQ